MGCNKIRVFIILKKRKLRLNSKFREKRNKKNKGEGEERKGRGRVSKENAIYLSQYSGIVMSN